MKRTSDEWDNLVEEWHTGEDPRELHEFLGLTWEEYGQWIKDPGHFES